MARTEATNLAARQVQRLRLGADQFVFQMAPQVIRHRGPGPRATSTSACGESYAQAHPERARCEPEYRNGVGCSSGLIALDMLEN